MAEQYLLGIDIGTSGSSGVIVDDDLAVVASASTEHDFRVPNPGWLEHDADEVWWDDFVAPVPSSNSRESATKSSHHTSSASCSSHPGFGTRKSCSVDADATTARSSSTITPDDPDVPMSMPSRYCSAIAAGDVLSTQP